uniref:Ferulate 5-hydroxylase n=1 Tax=Kalanchoe fedtschenkoi TaxID=63787 RepID=A0A7N0T0U5_KALFE
MVSFFNEVLDNPIHYGFLVLLPLACMAVVFGRWRRYPPGPRGYPIIGNMGMMDQLTHRGLAKLAALYGGLVHLKMGHKHMLVVSTPEMAREVLQAQDHVFANRPATVAISYLTYDRADMAFGNYGPFWRQMRKICVMKVFSRKRAESWAAVGHEVDSAVEAIKKSIGSPVNLGELVFCLTRNVTYKSAFGSISERGQEEFVKILQEFSRLFGAYNVTDFFPWAGWIVGRKFRKRLEEARSSLDGFIDNIIEEHVEKRRRRMQRIEIHAGSDCKDDEMDMVDEMMAFYTENVGDERVESESIKFTKDNIKALIMDVMFGGTETVASAIEWAMAELMRNPEHLKKVQRELDEVVGLSRPVNVADLDSLTYLKAVLKETLRLHPPIPILRHETTQNTTISNYFIPAKTEVVVNAWAIGRDASAWPEAHKFDPARFLKENAPDFKGSDFEFLPFGAGRRSCPGMQLGLYTLNLTTARLAHCFDWKLPGGMHPSDLSMDDMFGLTAPRASRLVAVPTYRLKC